MNVHALVLLLGSLLILCLAEPLLATRNHTKSEGFRSRQDRLRHQQQDKFALQEKKHSEFVTGKSKRFNIYNSLLSIFCFANKNILKIKHTLTLQCNR